MDGRMARGEESGMKSASWVGCWKGGGNNTDIGREDRRNEKKSGGSRKSENGWVIGWVIIFWQGTWQGRGVKGPCKGPCKHSPCSDTAIHVNPAPYFCKLYPSFSYMHLYLICHIAGIYGRQKFLLGASCYYNWRSTTNNQLMWLDFLSLGRCCSVV